jgi:type IV pilus assembly protein PilE
VHFRLKHRGVTLMELMITIMIVGILGAIAIPTYRTYTMKANRSDAKIALTNDAQQLERCYTTSNTYVGCLTLPSPSPQGFYTIDWEAVPTVTTYKMKATPVGTQANDTQCPTLKYDQAGVRTPAVNCW